MRSGTVFTNAWSTAPWTAPSMVSVMTGEYPPVHGVVYRDDTTPDDLPTLPRLLAERGYEIGNFSFFSQISYFRSLGLGGAQPGLREDRVGEAFATWLDSLDAEQPFFAWLHLLETHLPYGATGYRAAKASIPGSTGLEAAQTQGTVPLGSAHFDPGDLEPLLELYDQDVLAMDAALGKALDGLERSGRLERTLVVFVADHGEELLDSGSEPPWIGHASTAAAARLIPEVLRVPLVLAGPGVPRNHQVDRLVQQVDIFPTLLRLLGVANQPEVAGFDLPGLQRGWLAALRQFFSRTREAVFFDSSPAGNLTSPEQRGERLQGVSDGTCLVTTHLGQPGGGTLPPATIRSTTDPESATCNSAHRERLVRQLDDWRNDQTRRRLGALATTRDLPDLKAADSWPVRLAIAEPREPSLEWAKTGGQIALAWRQLELPEVEPGAGTSPKSPEHWWIEYRLVGGAASPAGGLATALLGEVSGAFAVNQRRVVFGPVPQGFWNDLAAYSPLEVRIVDPAAESRSPWQEYVIQPAP